jgi:hypothetical protein
VRTQIAYSTLESDAMALPWITLPVLAVGVCLARRQMRAAVGTAGFDIVVVAARLLRSGAARARAWCVPSAGSSATAVGIRRWAAGLLHSIRGRSSVTGPVGTWVRAHVRGQ